MAASLSFGDCHHHRHGLAGDVAARDKSEMGLNAGDIIDYLPLVLSDYERKLKGVSEHVL